VGIADPEARIRAVNGARRWLGPLLALSASSPFWQGSDTGFASYRSPVFRRWPNTGLPTAFADWEDFAGLVDALAAAGLVDDGTNLYWDVRPSVRYPTVEVRVADACPRLDDTLVIAALIRAVLRSLVDPATPPAGPPEAGPGARHELLEAAIRHAARNGLGGDLVHPATARQAPASEVVAALVAWCRPALEVAGDADRVDEGVERILASGGAAARLRAARESGGWDAVTELVVAETAAGAATS
jgi:carboxylate-amine ligase